MKKYIALSIITLAVGVAGTAQQLQPSSLYDLQGVFHNPAMAGARENGFVGASYRTQWSGISGSPKTITAFGSFNLPEQKIGVGGYLFNDVTGPTSKTGVVASFSKHILLKDGAKFSIGIEARAQQFSIDKDKLAQSLGTDPVLGAGENKFKFDAGMGIAYVGKRLEIGFSTLQLVQSKLGFYSGTGTRDEIGKLYRHYYLHGGYKLNLDERTTVLPNVLFIYLPNAPLEFQATARVEHNELFWWGLGFRSRQGIMVSAGLNINKKFSFGYAFDVYKTPVSVFDGGGNAHEFLLRYNLVK